MPMTSDIESAGPVEKTSDMKLVYYLQDVDLNLIPRSEVIDPIYVGVPGIEAEQNQINRMIQKKRE